MCSVFYIVFTIIKHSPSKTNSKTPPLSITESSDQSLLQAFADGVVVCSTDGRVLSMNDSASKITGWPIADAHDLDFLSVMPFADENGNPLPRESSPISLALAQKSTTKRTLKLANHSTKIVNFVDVTISTALINNDSSVVVVMRNVDEKIKQDTERSDFVSTASHEMRTPVAAIKGFLELSLNPQICKIDENAKKYLTKAHDATEHLGKLFQDLLTVSRSEDGRLPNNPVKIDLSDFIKELTEQLNLAAQAKNLKLVLTLDNTDTAKNSKFVTNYLSFVDPVRLREVITNLFDNAVKYTESGQVGINLRGNQTSVIIDIQDSGIGIPKDDLSHIFQKFYRVDNSSTREIGGTGLGLYICKEIIEAMHGTISVDSTVGVGSTFSITLPRVY